MGAPTVVKHCTTKTLRIKSAKPTTGATIGDNLASKDAVRTGELTTVMGASIIEAATLITVSVTASFAKLARVTASAAAPTVKAASQDLSTSVPPTVA